MGFLGGIFGGVPILGGIAKGVDQVFGRPGDIVNHPGQFFGNVAQGTLSALPFIPGGAGALFGGGSKWATPLLGMFGGGAGNSGGGFGGSSGFGGGFGGGFNPGLLGLGLDYLTRNKYQDAGVGDKQLGIADFLGNAGKGFINQSTTGLPSLDSMGALSGERGLMNEQARNLGIGSPFGDFGPGSTNPYELTGPQLENYNTHADLINQGRQAAINNMKAQFAAQGITDPRATAALEAQIHAGHNNMLTELHSTLSNQAFGQRQQGLQQFQQELPGLYGAQFGRQTGLADLGRNFLAGRYGAAGDFYGDAARRAMSMYENGQNSTGALLGLGLGMGGGWNPGGMFPRNGTGPTMGGGGGFGLNPFQSTQPNGFPVSPELLPPGAQVPGGGSLPSDSGPSPDLLPPGAQQRYVAGAPVFGRDSLSDINSTNYSPSGLLGLRLWDPSFGQF